jgi:hypothetical protein
MVDATARSAHRADRLDRLRRFGAARPGGVHWRGSPTHREIETHHVEIAA